jgi:hypothetical protein
MLGFVVFQHQNVGNFLKKHPFPKLAFYFVFSIFAQNFLVYLIHYYMVKRIILGSTLVCLAFASCGKKKTDPSGSQNGPVLPGENATSEAVISAILEEFNKPVVADKAMESFILQGMRANVDTTYWNLEKFNDKVKGSLIEQTAYTWRNKDFYQKTADLDYRWFYEHDGGLGVYQGYAVFGNPSDEKDTWGFYKETYGTTYIKDGMVRYYTAKGCTSNQDSIRNFFYDKDEDFKKFEELKKEHLDKGNKLCINKQQRATTYIGRAGEKMSISRYLDLGLQEIATQTGEVLVRRADVVDFSVSRGVQLSRMAEPNDKEPISPFITYNQDMYKALSSSNQYTTYWQPKSEISEQCYETEDNSGNMVQICQESAPSNPYREISIDTKYSWEAVSKLLQTTSTLDWIGFNKPQVSTVDPLSSDEYKNYESLSTYTNDGYEHNYRQQRNSIELYEEYLQYTFFKLYNGNELPAEHQQKYNELKTYVGQKVNIVSSYAKKESIKIITPLVSFQLTEIYEVSYDEIQKTDGTKLASVERKTTGKFSSKPVEYEIKKRKKINIKRGLRANRSNHII